MVEIVEMPDVAKWFSDTLESFKNDPEYQAEVIMLINEWEYEPILRNEYDGD